MNEFWGKVHFWITIVAFNFIFLPLFVLGMAGQHRRIYDFSNYPNLSEAWMWDFRQFATISLVVMLLAQPIFLINFFGSMFKGKKASRNPYNANTLEWVAPSPPGHGNFEELPTCYRGPYEFSHPDRELDYWPQNEPG
jgi:cytochrome c oxidase subunit 1